MYHFLVNLNAYSIQWNQLLIYSIVSRVSSYTVLYIASIPSLEDIITCNDEIDNNRILPNPDDAQDFYNIEDPIIQKP